MKKIAFASCMSAQVFPDQPVWERIALERPDFLVLLGDSIYLDIHTALAPQDMDDGAFAEHLYSRYVAQMAQPQFAKLIKQMPKNSVFSIWDDHDFLWNDANGGEYTKGMAHRNKVIISTAFQEAFRQALASCLSPGSFPEKSTAAPFLDLNRPPLAYPSIDLGNDVWLHLSDGRTNRTRTWLISEKNCTLLGAEQRARFGETIKANPSAIHLFASSSTISGWKRYRNDLDWLKKLASKTRMMVLSGDIHRNEFDLFDTGGFQLHEATSSGAAVKYAVFIGKKLENFGLLEMDTQLSVKLFSKDGTQPEMARNYDMLSWQSV